MAFSYPRGTEKAGTCVIALVVIGNGRLDYLKQAITSAQRHLNPIHACIMVNDSGDPAIGRELDETYPGFRIIHHAQNQGMAAAVQSGWSAALETPADWIVHLEEDMEMIRDVPLIESINVLKVSPTLAQMCWKREPWWGSSAEISHGDQLLAICDQSNWGQTDTHTFHDHLFSLNPCVIPRRIVEMGWPGGPLGVGNESGMTDKLKEAGYLFGSWGGFSDEPWCRHLGYERGTAWQL